MLEEGDGAAIGTRALDRFHDQRSGRHVDIIGDVQVAENHRAAAHRAASADHGTAGDPDTAGHRRMGANLHVVADLYLIVELDAIGNDGVTQSAAIDGGAGTDLDVVTDQHPPDLGNLDPGARRFAGEAETIGADHRPGMDQATLSQTTARINRHIGRQPAAGANLYPRANAAIGGNQDPIADLRAGADPHVGSDTGTGRDLTLNHCARMHAGFGGGLRTEPLRDTSVIEIGLRRQNCGRRSLRCRRRHDHGGSAGGRQLTTIFGIGKKGQVAGTGIFERVNPGNHRIASADYFSAKPGDDLVEPQRHG